MKSLLTGVMKKKEWRKYFPISAPHNLLVCDVVKAIMAALLPSTTTSGGNGSVQFFPHMSGTRVPNPERWKARMAWSEPESRTSIGLRLQPAHPPPAPPLLPSIVIARSLLHPHVSFLILLRAPFSLMLLAVCASPLSMACKPTLGRLFLLL